MGAGEGRNDRGSPGDEVLQKVRAVEVVHVFRFLDLTQHSPAYDVLTISCLYTWTKERGSALRYLRNRVSSSVNPRAEHVSFTPTFTQTDGATCLCGRWAMAGRGSGRRMLSTWGDATHLTRRTLVKGACFGPWPERWYRALGAHARCLGALGEGLPWNHREVSNPRKHRAS